MPLREFVVKQVPRRRVSSHRRPGLAPGPITPGVGCSKRRLLQCRNENTRRMGPGLRRDDVYRIAFVQSRYTLPRSRDSIRPRFANHSPNQREGAGKTGCALHPRSRVQRCLWKRTRAYRFSGSSPAFPAQWFYSLYRALPGETWLVCHRRPQEVRASQELDTCHRGVRTTRLCRTLVPRSSVAALASTAPRPNVSDDGQRPLSRDGMARNKQVIWVWSQG
jgi:hypothetical protein